MFPRGARFPASKASEVPGPGAYNPQDPDYDAYKRGAFLEKTNRFNKDKASEVPGPGAYDTDSSNGQNKPPAAKPSAAGDRLLALQRKLEDLERIHVEEKKAHALEQERFKLELNRAQRTAAEQTERAEKLKKQNDALESRVQELKKTTTTEQAELRELRVKLRASEHERTQLAAKQSDAGEARKALQAAETRRKDELRERDRKIAELEKSLAMERKKRETAEAKWQEVKGKTDDRVQQALTVAQELESQLQESREETRAAQQALEQAEARAGNIEEDLLARLEQHRAMLARVAEEYSRLASTSVARSIHDRAKQEAITWQLRGNRLERKLANSEGQVVELANLIRQVKEENAFLASQLVEAQSEVEAYRHTLHDIPSSLAIPDHLHDLVDSLAAIVREQLDSAGETHQIIQTDLNLWYSLYRLQRDSLVYHSTTLNKELDIAHSHSEQRVKELAAAEATQAHLSESLKRAQADHAEAQRMLAETTASLAEAKAHEESYQKQLEVVKADSHAEITRIEQSLQREKEAAQRLSSAVHKAKQAEQFLRSEVEQLSSDLAEAEKYQEAYNNLLAEVDALVLRNALAEEEAQRLSKFNAEILGHNNPAQRIVYVDRIRRELHETKQKLLLSTREREAVLADNEELRHELELYKSVGVPHEIKPRTTITRVGRVPSASSDGELGASLAPRTSESTLNLPRSSSTSGPSARLASVPESSSGSGIGDEMTLDEIM
ncbi:hypothetical protein FKP32DRAFT_1656684 [Trametes sanguinea]|nr:hypothetical protein FKP32DRAFT_1656684 [Trametes sanguinea]